MNFQQNMAKQVKQVNLLGNESNDQGTMSGTLKTIRLMVGM